MAETFGTAAWAEALAEQINGSSEYRNAASAWGVGFDGNVVLAFEADEGLSQPCNLYLELEGGRCGSAAFVDGEPQAGFVLSGPFMLWREILERKTLAATAILSGSLKVTGQKMTLLKHTAANRALIHCAASVETRWPE